MNTNTSPGTAAHPVALMRKISCLRWLMISLLVSLGTMIHAQTPAHVYEFNGSFADSMGGSAMVSGGGTLGASTYSFAAGQGPNVSNVLASTGEYTIEMVMRFDAVSSYRSILNFNALSSDNAFYCSGGYLIFYSYSASAAAASIVAGQTHRVVMTRNASTKVTTAYVDGVQQLQVTDTNNYYVASASGGILHFFRDNGSENSSGFVDQIRIYNSELTPVQVAGLSIAGTAPTVTTPTSASIASVSATLGGNVTSDGGATITERGVVYAATATNSDPAIGGSGVTKVTTSGTTGVFTASVTGLLGATGYSFKAYATNVKGTSYSSAATFTTLAATVPGAPSIGTATGGNGSASVAFTAPVSNGGSAITGYTVTSSPGGFTGTGAASPITVNGLTNGTAYTFTVTAANAVGIGSASAASNSVTPATVPGAPTIGTATPGNTTASVTFTAPASNGGSAITGYTVTSSPGNLTGTGSASPISVTGLTNGTAYTFTVKATNAVGAGAASAASNSVTPRPPPTVSSISPTTGGNAGGTSVTITGANFTGATGVTIGGTAATSVTVVNSTTITCTTPAGTVGTASVLVTTPVGTNSANTLFTYFDSIVTATFTTASSVPVTAASYTATGKTVNFTLSYAPTTGTTLTVVNNTGLGFISGTFSNLTQGQAVALPFNGTTYNFVANYFGGTGNDLMLVWAGTRAMAWGDNGSGQLGDNSSTARWVPTNVINTGVLSGKTILTATVSWYHSLALCSDGTLASWGSNIYGGLGNNSTTSSSVPVAVFATGVLSGKRVVAISAGRLHSLALCSDGTLAAWGLNASGQLGNNSTTQSNVPVAVNGGALSGKTVIAIAAGYDSNLALCSDGTLVAWGDNQWGQLGNNSTTNALVPVAINSSGVLSGRSVVAISSGTGFSLARCSDGTLAAWGNNGGGRLGNSSTTDSLVPVAVTTSGALSGKSVVSLVAGGGHAMALCSDGTLATWGNNDVGQLGMNSASTSSSYPVTINSIGVLNGKTVTAIAAGQVHCLALCSDGTLAAWGMNYNGVLGDNTTTTRYVPVAVNTSPLAVGERFMFISAAPSAYSNQSLVAIPPLAPPTVTSPTSVTNAGTSAILGGNSAADGGPVITERGVVYAVTSTNNNPIIGGTGVTKVTASGTTGVFTVSVTGLSADTVYSFKAYATNSLGTSYSDVATFATATQIFNVNATYTAATDAAVTSPNPALNSGTVTFALGFAPSAGTNLTVVNNTGRDFISGTFSNLAQGQAVALTYNGATFNFVANYFGGTGNDLVLVWAGTRVMAWGSNSNGQLGDSSTTNRLVPTNVLASGVLAGKTVLAVSAGNGHSLALCSDGTLAAWGYNASGQLGINSTTNSSVPVAVTITGTPLAGKTIIAIAAGGSHNLVLCSDGTLAAWGNNGSSGSLGNGSTTNSLVPVAVTKTGTPLAGKTIIAIAAGGSHSMALCLDGTLAAWGYNAYGQLGNSSNTTSLVPVAVTTVGTALAGKTVTGIACGESYSVALCSDGSVAAWGYNGRASLGNNSTTHSNVPVAVTTAGTPLAGKTIVAISAGNEHNLALCSDGTLAAWGYNSSGQLGNSSTTWGFVPVAVTTSGVLAGKTVVAIGAGYECSRALCSDGTLTAWGSNSSGRLGDNTTTQRSAPVAVSTTSLTANERFVFAGSGVVAHHSMGLVAPAYIPTVASISPTRGSIAGGTSVTITGGNFTGATSVTIGGAAATNVTIVNATTITCTTPAGSVGTASVVVTSPYGSNPANTLYTYFDPIVTATYASAADIPVTTDSSYLATGRTVNFTLGYAPTAGTTFMVLKNTGTSNISGTFSNIAQGQVVGLTFNGVTYRFRANYYGGTGNDLVLAWADTRAMAWGYNDVGQLGDSGTTNRVVPVNVLASGVLAGKTVLAVSAGDVHSLALCSDGTLAAWGQNSTGQLGNGSTTNSSVPVAVVNSGVLSGKTVVAIAAGYRHNLALCSDGTLASWGYNPYGALGNNSSTNSSVPVAVNTSGVLSGKAVIAIAAGWQHSLALCSDGTLAAWGYNQSGQLGNNSQTTTLVPVTVSKSGNALAGKTIIALSAGNDHSVALCSDGTLAAWGANDRGQLGNNSTSLSLVPVAVTTSGLLSGKAVVSVVAGWNHTVALCSDGTLAAWGNNGYGQLGNNSTTQSTVPTAVTTSGVLSGKTVINITAGTYHSFALCSDGTMVAWGDNIGGQLGNNSTTSSLVPVAVSTTSLAAGERFVAPARSSFGFHSLALVASPPVAPSVSAPTFASVRPTTATLGGNVTSGGDAAITARGVVFAKTSLNANPRIGGANVTVVNDPANTTGIFTEAVTDLTPNTGYSFAAFATNSQGTSYSTVGTFLTAYGDVTATYTAATNVPVTLPTPILDGGTATLALGYAPTVGTELMVVKNTGLGFITGSFSNLVHGQLVPLSFGGTTYQFVANYYGGTGNDLVLQWAYVRPVGWVYVSQDYGQVGEGGSASTKSVPTATVLTGALLGKTILTLAVGGYHTLALCSDGSLAAWGDNDFGQLGDNTTTDRRAPVKVPATGALAGKTVVAIAAGNRFSVALCSDGTVAAWGENSSGQLGNNSTTDSLVPVAVDRTGVLAGKTVVAVSAGGNQVLALCSDGTLATWGPNIGVLNGGNNLVPVAVNQTGVLAGRTVVEMAAGNGHYLVRCSDGVMAAWGAGDGGQLGNGGSYNNSGVPVQVVTNGVLAGKTVTAIDAGGTCSLVACSDGTLAGWGWERIKFGGTGSSTPYAMPQTGALAGKTVVSITSNSSTSVVVCSDGTAASWGGWPYLGNGSVSGPNPTEPVAVSRGALTSGERFLKPFSDAYFSCTVALVAAPPPPAVVTGISPSTGPATGGTFVTITGTGFTGASGVMIGGVQASAVSVVNSNTITCFTESAPAGPASVAVLSPIHTSYPQNSLFTFQSNTTTTLALTGGGTGVYGQTAPVSVTVSATNPYQAPVGSVSLIKGGTIIASTTRETPGAWTFTPSGLNVGTHTVTAQYDGDEWNNASSSSSPASVTFTLTQATGSLALASSLNPSNQSDPVTFTATLTPASGGGTVTFKDGTTTLGTAVLNAQGIAAFTPTTPLRSGTRAITAVFAGDPNVTAATSPVLYQGVNQNPNAIVLTNLAQYYDGTPKAPTAVTVPANLQVNFTYLAGPHPGTTNLGSTPPTAVGTYTVVATIDDPVYDGTASSTFVINKGQAMVAITNENRIYDDTPKPVTVTVVPAGLSYSVTYAGSPTAPSALGRYPVVATITDPNYEGSATATLDISNAAVTTTTLVSSANPSAFFTSPTFTARATSTERTGLSGYMELLIDGVLLEKKLVDADGYATFAATPAVLRGGPHAIKAVYNGDRAVEEFASSNVTITQTVTKEPIAVTLSDLSQVYTGTGRAATATVTPPATHTAVQVDLTYDGSPALPVNVGTYEVVATVNDPSLAGTATGTLTITKAPVNLFFGNTTAGYDGAPHPVTVAAIPDIPVALTYQLLIDGVPTGTPSATAPSAVGSYRVVATASSNYEITPSSGTLTITKKGVTITLRGLSPMSDGTPKAVTVVTDPPGMNVAVTYTPEAGGTASSTPPSPPTGTAGKWKVLATVSDTNYRGTAEATLNVRTRHNVVPTLTGPPASVPYSTTLNYLATVPAAPNAPTPTGRIIFKIGTETLETVTINSLGQALFSHWRFTVRSAPYSITASYSGDENYFPTESAAISTVVTKAPLTLTVDSPLTVKYDGTPKPVVFSTAGKVERIDVVYGNTYTPDIPPTLASNYPVTATIVDPNFTGSLTVTLKIEPRIGAISLDYSRFNYDGNPKHITYTVDPPGGIVRVRYYQNDQEIEPPTLPGTYHVRASSVPISNILYPEVEGDLVISNSNIGISFTNKTVAYNGMPQQIGVVTNPSKPYELSTYLVGQGWVSSGEGRAAGRYLVRATVNAVGYEGSSDEIFTIKPIITGKTIGYRTRKELDSRAAAGLLPGSTGHFKIDSDDWDGSTKDVDNGEHLITYVPDVSATERYVFQRWSDGVTANPREVKLGSITPVASGVEGIHTTHFPDEMTYTAQAVKEGHPSIQVLPSSDLGTVQDLGWMEDGMTMRLRVTPKPGYIVDYWSYGSETRIQETPSLQAAPGGSFLARLLNRNKELPAIKRTFSMQNKVASVKLVRGAKVTCDATEGGSVELERDNQYNSPNQRGTTIWVPDGRKFIATAIPEDASWRFSGWSLSGAEYANPDLNTNSRDFATVFQQKQLRQEFVATSSNASVVANFIKWEVDLQPDFGFGYSVGIGFVSVGTIGEFLLSNEGALTAKDVDLGEISVSHVRLKLKATAGQQIDLAESGGWLEFSYWSDTWFNPGLPDNVWDPMEDTLDTFATPIVKALKPRILDMRKTHFGDIEGGKTKDTLGTWFWPQVSLGGFGGQLGFDVSALEYQVQVNTHWYEDGTDGRIQVSLPFWSN